MNTTLRSRWLSFRWFKLLATALAVSSAAYAAEPTCIPDKEPNDRPETAMSVTGTFCVEGSIGENDQDILAWSVSNADAGQAWTIELEGIPGQETKVQLHRTEEPAQADTPATVSAEFFSIATPTGTNRASATDIFVTPGNYLLGLSVSGTTDPKATYTLVLRRAGLLVPETEREPNDTQTTAMPLGQARSVRGRLVGLEQDTFRFEVRGQPQLWRAEVAGRGVKEFALLDKHGMPAGSRMPLSDVERLEITNLFLMPGEHWIAVEGENADYVVTLEPTGVPDPNMEHEPNDNEERAHKLEFGLTRTGTLAEVTDQDVYRFSLPTTDHVALRLEPPADRAVAVALTWVHPSLVRPSSVAIGKPIIYDAVLAPGDYYMTLSTQKESKAPYRLMLERRDFFDVGDDVEPTDAPEQAQSIPETLSMSGTVGGWSDEDWFRLPNLKEPTKIRIHCDDGVSLRLVQGQDEIPFERTADSAAYEGSVPAGGGALLDVLHNLKQAYEVTLMSTGTGRQFQAAEDVRETGFGPPPPSVNQYTPSKDHYNKSRYCEARIRLDNGETDQAYFRMDGLKDGPETDFNFDPCFLSNDVFQNKCADQRPGQR